jgi:hypothetical protein
MVSTMKRFVLAVVPAFMGATWLAAGCNGVLGIDEAKVDPSLIDASNTGLVYDCPSYCATIAKNCTGANLEYVTDKACTEMCGHFDLGRPGDEDGDSLACRVYHANAAAMDPNVHCRHAGPLGGTHCGDPCSAFCLQDLAICGTTAYASESQCRTTCALYPYLTAGPGAGDVSIEDGPTLNCRLYHLESAVVDPVTHCNHTSLNNVHCTTPPADGGLDAH